MASTVDPPFIFVNKTQTNVTVQQKFKALPAVASKLQTLEIPAGQSSIPRNGEWTLTDNIVEQDPRYERVVLLTRLVLDIIPNLIKASEVVAHTVVSGIKKGISLIKPSSSSQPSGQPASHQSGLEISLSGRPASDKIIIYPVAYPPYTAVTTEKLFFFKLLQSVILGSQEALTVFLEEAVTHPFLLEALKNATANITPTVEQIKDIIDIHERKPISIPYRIRHGVSDGLCPEETAARQTRFSIIRNNFKLPDEASNVPVIATATSGGGMRAMIASVGFLSAMKSMGFLDMLTYTAALSGSTWSTSKWMNAPQNPFLAYKNDSSVPDCLSHDVPPQASSEVDLSGLLQTGATKVTPDDAMKIVWESLEHGSLLLGYAKLISGKLSVDSGNYLNYVGDKVSSGQFPIPVYTASFKDNQKSFQWFDFTPYEIGSTYLETYFKLDYFQLYSAPTPPLLSQLMAVWGSAFYATFAEIIEEFSGSTLPSWLSDLLGTASFLEGAEVVNANYNQTDPSTGALLPMANQRNIYYRDGGIAANLPVPPLLRPERGVQLIIVLDASSDVEKYPFKELVSAVPSIASKIPANPTFPYKFEAGDDYPQIIYIPLLKNADFNPNFDPIDCGTFEFQYDQDKTTNLQGLAGYWATLAKDQITQSIASLTSN